jgi:predicted ATPase
MPLLHQIRLENLLSFGPKTGVLHLRPLNVLIGPNGSGKSNLIEVIGLLCESPKNLAEAVRSSGGIHQWIWKGASPSGIPSVSALIAQKSPHKSPLHHHIAFSERDQRFDLVDEFIKQHNDANVSSPRFIYNFKLGNHPTVLLPSNDDREIPSARKERSRSILAQLRDPEQFPELAFLAEQYERTRIYRDWSFGRTTLPRLPQKTDGRSDYLESDCGNLAMVINRIRRDPAQKEQLIERLNDLYPGIKDVDVSIEGGTAQVFLTEGKFAMPATRLSDGTLRYLCLLAILLHPTPPPLICIEEPELGLHPDVMPAIGKLLKQASERTQLIVTTHSEVLVDSLSDSPEDVVVCEKHDGCTTFDRLDADQLNVWLGEYSLGHLWRSGQLGGNRW